MASVNKDWLDYEEPDNDLDPTGLIEWLFTACDNDDSLTLERTPSGIIITNIEKDESFFLHNPELLQ